MGLISCGEYVWIQVWNKEGVWESHGAEEEQQESHHSYILVFQERGHVFSFIYLLEF